MGKERKGKVNASISVERYVEQVRDGSHYKGYIKIAETKLDYELRFTTPIKQIDRMAPVGGRDKIRRLFQIAIKKEEKNIELTDDEYGFFFQMIVPYAVEFYNNPQTRDSNEGFLGRIVRGEMTPMANFGRAKPSITISYTNTDLYEFPSEIREILSSPKFAC